MFVGCRFGDCRRDGRGRRGGVTGCRRVGRRLAASQGDRGGEQGGGEQGAVCHRMLRRSEEHTSELQSLMRISYAVFCLKKKRHRSTTHHSLCTNGTPSTPL